MIAKLDYTIGLRALGLVLYGALPANLAVLGILKVELTPLKAFSSLYLLAAILLPSCVVCMLVRSRLRLWYCTSKWLLLRSSILTMLILITASMVCGLAGIIKGNYVLNVTAVFKPSEWHAMTESMLMAVAALVLTSTLFAGILVKGDSLPGLPSAEFAQIVSAFIRFSKRLNESGIWRHCPDDDSLKRLKQDAAFVMEKIKDASSIGGYLNSVSVSRLRDDMTGMETALEELVKRDNTEIREQHWGLLFGTSENLLHDDLIHREQKRDMIQRLKNIKSELY